MFTIFKKKVPAVVKESPVINTVAIIEEIHNAFETASDEALAEANRILAKDASEDDKKYSALLKKAGFNSSKLVKEIDTINNDHYQSKKRAEIIQKYANKYPQYKFIFFDQVEMICKKYNLVCGSVHQYTGTVPRKNIEEISNFKVNDEDIYVRREIYFSGGSYGEFTLSECKKLSDEEKEGYCYPGGYSKPYLVPFYICAPASDMELRNRQKIVNGVIIDIPDPIVLHYVKDGYLIVSKWGIEASDQLLT